MKLENYINKTDKKRKVLLISLGTIVLISVSLLLYKTFASFNEHVEFPMMNGKVDYFGNSDVYFAFYKGDEQLEQMPKRDNSENLAFKRGECDNGASIVWNEEEWAPLVKNLSKSKTKCSLYFEETTPFVREVVKCGQGGTAATSCITNNVNLNEPDLAYDGKEVLGELGTDENNLRFVGANPSNYVLFNNGELWRILGIIDGKLKIMRSKNTQGQNWDTNGNNDWENSTVKIWLNETYVINSDLVVEGSWNIGKAIYETTKNMYSLEKGAKWNGKVGLISASDYGYAVGKNLQDTCLNLAIKDYNTNNCAENDWIYNINPGHTTWTMIANSAYTYIAFSIGLTGNLYNNSVTGWDGVFPVVYLKETTRITGGTGEENNPFILK